MYDTPYSYLIHTVYMNEPGHTCVVVVGES